jgi:hypothetical protein
MSASHTWFSRLMLTPLTRLGYRGKRWRLSVVFTFLRLARHSRSLSFISRKTFLWFTSFPSRFSAAVTRR